MHIQTLSQEAPSRFAAQELQSYLVRMGCPTLNYRLDVCDLTPYGLPAVADPSLDDQYVIHVQEDEQYIYGNNPRSVLLGVYRYLTLIGCRFLRPGKAFEVVPVRTNVTEYYASETHTASLRHRGACLEGADSIDNILDFLDWSPKIGFNSFFFQFKYPQAFLERYYSHKFNPLLEPESWTMEDSVRIMPYFNDEMVKRGLLQHRVGHGWTSEVLGCSATGWDSEEVTLAPEIQPLVAEINGKRELWGGIPTNTNLCLSNPEAVERFSDLVIQYVQANPQTDYLHIWLADDTNNSCECENCRKKRPSDHYAALLNRIDEKLTTLNSKTRLVMLLYVDLLWAPIATKLNNPDRFVLMFAPITRTFETSYAEHGPLNPTPEFNLNHLKFPRDVETNISFLKDWQAFAPCDSFVYDYPLGRAHYGDPAYVGISKLIYDDLQYNRELGLNGINSCQELRVAFPNALPNYVMGQTSLNLSRSFEEIADEYYTACYGPDGKALLPLMTQVSALFSPNYLMGIGPRENPELAERIQKVPAVLEQIKALIASHSTAKNEVQAHMWQELSFFVTYTETLAKITELSASGHLEEARDLYENSFCPLVQAHEMVDQSGLDMFRVQMVFNNRFFGPKRD